MAVYVYPAPINRCQDKFENSGKNLAYINGLPDELLIEIFLNVRDVVLREHRDHKAFSEDWIQLSHTCSTWRTIALTSALLWTQVTSQCPSRMVSFLARSRTAPVRLTLNSRISLNPMAPLISQHAHRIVCLEVVLSRDSASQLSILSRIQFPNLKTFEAIDPLAPSPSSKRFHQIPLHPWPIPTTFIHLLPQLEHLHLDHACILWGSSVYRGLKSLDLSMQRTTSSCAPSMTTFLDMLQTSAPTLEVLSLRFAGPMLRPVSHHFIAANHQMLPPPTRKLALNKLRRLVMENEPWDIAHLLSHFILPQSTFLDLVCHIADSEEASSQSIVFLPEDTGDLAPLKEVSSIVLSVSPESPPRISLNASSATSQILNFTLHWSLAEGNTQQMYDKATEFFEHLPRIFTQEPGRTSSHSLFLGRHISCGLEETRANFGGVQDQAGGTFHSNIHYILST
ncbi:hypothetical protein ABKN59_009035 [Abortiporus biennis]